MSFQLEKGAIFALLLSISACGDDAATRPSGGGGSGAGATSTADTIVGQGSTGAGGPATTTGDGTGAGGAAGDSSSSGGGEDPSGPGPGGGDPGSGGSGGGGPALPCPDFASEVVEVAYGPGAGFGQADFPDIVFGGPRGRGEAAGSLDVLSLGNGGSITLGFADRRIVDGEGPDFIVFENAFWAGGNPEHPFAELGTVEVSADGETWAAFPCTALEAPFGSCAGWHPIYANVEDNDLDPLDPAVAGGDAFDLADIGLEEVRFVRIVDRADQPGLSGMFDLDAISIVHGSCVAPD